MMRFDETTGRRAEVALELLSEGHLISFRGLCLQLAPSGVLECSVSTEHDPDHVDVSGAMYELSWGKAVLADLIESSEGFASLIATRETTWEIFYDYGGGSIRLCRLDDAGNLVWS